MGFGVGADKRSWGCVRSVCSLPSTRRDVMDTMDGGSSSMNSLSVDDAVDVVPRLRLGNTRGSSCG